MNKILSRVSLVALFLAASLGLGTSFAYAATISTQLDIGSTGQEVTDLQTYLASNSSLYPSGLVTGYFGALTQAGVQRFQAAQGIVSSGSPTTTGYGRVGPSTRARLNALMTSSGPVSGTVPVLSNPMVQRSATSLTFSWNTNEPTIGQVYWSTSPIQANEATGPHQTPFVSGTLALDNTSGFQIAHSITVSGLQSNATYYYFIRSIDSSGDMSVILPQVVTTN